MEREGKPSEKFSARFDPISLIETGRNIAQRNEKSMITSATAKDLPDILNIYEHARTFMAQSGNPAQWADGYPQKELLLRDIERKQLYLCRDARIIYGVFAFIIGEDRTYSYIENGSWFSDAPYGTIHRIAGNGTKKDVFAEALSYCESKISHLRIDTHRDNRIMQYLIEKHGFRKCGTIYVADGSPRIAYEKIL